MLANQQHLRSILSRALGLLSPTIGVSMMMLIALLAVSIVLAPPMIRAASLSDGPRSEMYVFDNLPSVGSAGGEVFGLGGFSGLHFDGEVDGKLRFITHPDRGPNAKSVLNSLPVQVFALPDYAARLVFFELDRESGSLSVTRQVFLRTDDGMLISGLPNKFGDEIAISTRGDVLGSDPMGADFEGLVRTPNGDFWLCDEYRPSLYHFDSDGRLIARYVPEGTHAADQGAVTSSRDGPTHGRYGIEALPAVYGLRRHNRGFEGIAYDRGRIYAFMQSPINNPPVSNGRSSTTSVHARILEFDIRSRTTTAEYLYVLEGGKVDKIGDAVAIGQGQFFVIERDSAAGSRATKKVFRIDIAGATNLRELDPATIGPGGRLELMSPAELRAAGIRAVTKRLHVDLIAAGYSLEKPEAIALVPPDVIAVLNDDDFGLTGEFDPHTGELLRLAQPQPIVLGLIRVKDQRP